jgi:hypothetical protein
VVQVSFQSKCPSYYRRSSPFDHSAANKYTAAAGDSANIYKREVEIGVSTIQYCYIKRKLNFIIDHLSNPKTISSLLIHHPTKMDELIKEEEKEMTC